MRWLEEERRGEAIGVSSSFASGGHGNCSYNLSSGDLEAIRFAKISVSGAAIVACIAAILLILVLKQYSKFVYRLVLYLMVAALLQGVTTILEVLPVSNVNGEVKVIQSRADSCAAFAFLNQVTTWMEYLIVWWILSYLLVLTLLNYKASTLKHEICGLIIVTVVPLAINWIPFIGHKYGLSGLWCWIKVVSYYSPQKRCEVSTVSIVYMVVFLYGPLMLLILFGFVAFLVIIGVLCKLHRKTRGANSSFMTSLSTQGIQEALPLLAYPLIYNIIFSIIVVNRVYDALLANEQKGYYFPLWVAHAVADPAQSLFLPLGFMLHPNTLKKLFTCIRLRIRRRQSHEPLLQESSAATAFVVSHGSVAEVDPLVIRSTMHKSSSAPVSVSSAAAPSNHKSIFEGDDNYYE